MLNTFNHHYQAPMWTLSLFGHLICLWHAHTFYTWWVTFKIYISLANSGMLCMNMSEVRVWWYAHHCFQTAVNRVTVVSKRTEERLISRATPTRNISQSWQSRRSHPPPESVAPGSKDGWCGDRWCLRCGGDKDRCRGAPYHGPLETEAPRWEQTAW